MTDDWADVCSFCVYFSTVSNPGSAFIVLCFEARHCSPFVSLNSGGDRAALKSIISHYCQQNWRSFIISHVNLKVTFMPCPSSVISDGKDHEKFQKSKWKMCILIVIWIYKLSVFSRLKKCDRFPSYRDRNYSRPPPQCETLCSLECYNSPWTEPVDWKVWLYQCCNPSWLHGIVSYQCILSLHSFIMCKNGIDIVVWGFARCEGIHSLSSSVAKWAAVCIDGAWTEKVGPLETMQRVWRQ